MLAYIVRRTLLAAFTIFVISLLTFVIVQLPEGDMVDSYLQLVHERGLGDAPGRTDYQIESLKEAWGLNRPLIVQWWDWFSGIIFRADFGHSFSTAGFSSGGPVAELIANRLPYTIYLSIFTVMITWTFAIPVGIYSAIFLMRRVIHQAMNSARLFE